MEETRESTSSRVENIIAVSTITGLLISMVALWFLAPHWIFWAIVGVYLTCVLSLMLDFTLRRVFRFTWRDIGQWGTVGTPTFGKTKMYAPLSLEAPKAEGKVKVELVVPTVAELLKDGMLGTDSLLLGYSMDGKPYYGAWNDIRTFAIAGKGRSGKTVTMFFLILQAILNECIIWVADPHAAKKSSITSLLQPLAQWIRFAKTDAEIAEMTADFIDVMEGRITGEHQDQTPMLLVTDEFTRMVDSNEQVYEAVVACAQQYAGVNGFAMIAGHEWTGNRGMLVKLRRAVHAKFVHRLDEGYAKYLLNDGRRAKTAEKLHTGYNYFQDSEGDIHELKTPLGTVQDAVTVAGMLQQLTGPEYLKQIVSPAETDGFKQAETNDFRSTEQLLSIEAPSETNDFSTYQGRKEGVRKMRSLNFKQSEIIFKIWGARPGETETYRNAVAEYKHIVETLLQEVQA